MALVAVLLIIVFLRWAFSQKTRHDPFAPAPDPSGLLQVVATLPTPQEARAMRAVLSDAEIRSTVRDRPRGGTDVLVFPADAPQARRLAGPYAAPGSPH